MNKYRVLIETVPQIEVSVIITANSEEEARQMMLCMRERGEVKWEEPVSIHIERIRDTGWIGTRVAHIVNMDVAKIEVAIALFMDSDKYNEAMTDIEVTQAFKDWNRELTNTAGPAKGWDIESIADASIQEMKSEKCFDECSIDFYVGECYESIRRHSPDEAREVSEQVRTLITEALLNEEE